MASQAGNNSGGEGTATTKSSRTRKRLNRTRTVGARVGTGIGTAGMNFSPMQKAAGSDLAHLVYGFSLGRGIAPKQAVGYLNSIAETW